MGVFIGSTTVTSLKILALEFTLQLVEGVSGDDEDVENYWVRGVPRVSNFLV